MNVRAIDARMTIQGPPSHRVGSISADARIRRDCARKQKLLVHAADVQHPRMTTSRNFDTHPENQSAKLALTPRSLLRFDDAKSACKLTRTGGEGVKQLGSLLVVAFGTAGSPVECSSANDDIEGTACDDENATCEVGEECCCGECSPSLDCSCDDGRWSCYYTDFCAFTESCGGAGGQGAAKARPRRGQGAAKAAKPANLPLLDGPGGLRVPGEDAILRPCVSG
jgi:hypothetical protein